MLWVGSHRCILGSYDLFVPAAGALSIGARARVPDTLVRHDCGGCRAESCGLTKGWWAVRDGSDEDRKFCVNRDVPPKAIGGLPSPSWERGQFSCVRHVISRTKSSGGASRVLSITDIPPRHLGVCIAPHIHCGSCCYGETWVASKVSFTPSSLLQSSIGDLIFHFQLLSKPDHSLFSSSSKW
jgi:hypothetical protein